MSEPRYRHECSGCVFLGPYVYKRDDADEGLIVDLYCCPQCDGGSVVARWSDEDYKYASSMVALVRGDENGCRAWMPHAVKLAHERGLLHLLTQKLKWL